VQSPQEKAKKGTGNYADKCQKQQKIVAYNTHYFAISSPFQVDCHNRWVLRKEMPMMAHWTKYINKIIGKKLKI
jgi:hypothetical protein